jgi:hypothetical protein
MPQESLKTNFVFTAQEVREGIKTTGHATVPYLYSIIHLHYIPNPLLGLCTISQCRVRLLMEIDYPYER